MNDLANTFARNVLFLCIHSNISSAAPYTACENAGLFGCKHITNLTVPGVEAATKKLRCASRNFEGPLGTTPILDLPYSVNVISRQLIDDTQSRNFKEAAKYVPLVSFQEMQDGLATKGTKST